MTPLNALTQWIVYRESLVLVPVCYTTPVSWESYMLVPLPDGEWTELTVLVSGEVLEYTP